MNITYAYLNKSTNNVVVGQTSEQNVPADAIVFQPGETVCAEDPTGVYQTAWYIQNGKILVNLDKAKQIKMQFIRETREIHLEQFDRLQARYIGSGDMERVKKIETIKQSLRDAPATIDWDSIKTVDELRLVVPPVLGYD